MEFWDLYNRDGHRLDIQIKRGELIPENTFHRVIHVWIINELGEFLLQKRAPHLTWFPNKWATTSGSVMSGEWDLIESAYREFEEELGLDATMIDIEFERDIILGNSIVSILKGFLPKYMTQSIRLNDEVSEVKWGTKSKISMLREAKEFAEYSEELFQIVMNMKLNMN